MGTPAGVPLAPQGVPLPITAAWVFWVTVAVVLIAAIAVVVLPNVIHAALALGLCFSGIAGIYILLHAQFLAVAQVLVYVGDITVLILFALMLTRGVAQPRMEQWGVSAVWGGLIAILVAGMMTSYLGSDRQLFIPPTQPTSFQDALPSSMSVVQVFCQQMLTVYVLPFEVASGILLMALVGAIVIAREEHPDDAR